MNSFITTICKEGISLTDLELVSFQEIIAVDAPPPLLQSLLSKRSHDWAVQGRCACPREKLPNLE